MPPEQPKPGLRELQEVLQRIGSTTLKDSLGKGLTPAQYGQIASRLYDGSSPWVAGPALDDTHPAMLPESWRNLAAWHDPEYAIENRPAVSYDDYQLAGPLVDEALGRVDNSLKGYGGIGWSREDIDKRREQSLDPNWMPAPHELSPGDYVAHQRRRDLNLLQAMLNKGNGIQTDFDYGAMPGYSWDPTGLILRGGKNRHSVFPDGDGAPMAEDPEETARQNQADRIEAALHWYHKGNNARYAVGGEFGNFTANYPQYGNIHGTMQAMENPDFAFGNFSNAIGMQEYAHNRIAGRNARPDTDHNMSSLRRSLGGYVFAKGRDFLKNAMLWDGAHHPWDDANEVRKATQINRASPLLPTEEQSPDVFERSRLVRQARQALQGTNNLSATDDHYARTGKGMSFAGQIGASLASATQDPTIFASGLWPGSVGGRIARMGSELAEETPWGVAIAGTHILSPRPASQPLPHVKHWLSEDKRSDLPEVSPEQRQAELNAHDKNQDQALEQARKFNKATPTKYDGKSRLSPEQRRHVEREMGWGFGAQ